MPWAWQDGFYNQIASGEIAGSGTAAQMPALVCDAVRFTGASSNTGSVFIGAAGVTKPDGNTDTTTGIEVEPGDDTGWIPVGNMNVLYYICDNATDDLVFLALIRG